MSKNAYGVAIAPLSPTSKDLVPTYLPTVVVNWLLYDIDICFENVLIFKLLVFFQKAKTFFNIFSG